MAEQKKPVERQVAVMPPEQVERIWNQVKDLKQLKETLQISPQEIENTYALAYLLYEQKQFQSAADSFSVLMMMDPTDWRFSYGLAACRHALADWPNAALYFAVAAELNPGDPLPHYYTADCFLKLGNEKAAKLSYELVLERIAKQADGQLWKALKGQTELMLKQMGTTA